MEQQQPHTFNQSWHLVCTTTLNNSYCVEQPSHSDFALQAWGSHFDANHLLHELKLKNGRRYHRFYFFVCLFGFNIWESWACLYDTVWKADFRILHNCCRVTSYQSLIARVFSFVFCNRGKGMLAWIDITRGSN